MTKMLFIVFTVGVLFSLNITMLQPNWYCEPKVEDITFYPTNEQPQDLWLYTYEDCSQNVQYPG